MQTTKEREIYRFSRKITEEQLYNEYRPGTPFAWDIANMLTEFGYRVIKAWIKEQKQNGN